MSSDERSGRRSQPRGPGFPRAVPDLSPALERAIEQRWTAALAEVERIRAAHPDASVEELSNRLIRRYAKDMALGGAIAGGAAAAPVAGMAVAAASAGAESAYSVSRLGEMIMAIGLVHGHPANTPEERRAAVLAVIGMADGAAIGVSGIAARAGSKGGARLLRRLTPAAGATTGRTRATWSRVTRGRGPWSAAALVPYGIGAGVGAAGNALLARAVGRAAKEYYAARARRNPLHHHVEDAVDGELLDVDPADGEPVAGGGHRGSGATWRWAASDEVDDIVDALVVDPGRREGSGR